MTAPANLGRFLSEILDGIDEGQIPLHLAVQMTPERMQEVWDACDDPRVLHEMIIRTHPPEALLPLARAIAAATGVPQSYLENIQDVKRDVLNNRQWRSYVNTLVPMDTIEQEGANAIDRLFTGAELPLAWMEREGLFKGMALRRRPPHESWTPHKHVAAILRAAGPPTLEAAVAAAELSGRVRRWL